MKASIRQRHTMIKSLDEHRGNIKPEVRTAAKAKAIGIVAKRAATEAKKAKEMGQKQKGAQ